MFLSRFIPVNLFRPEGQARPNLQAKDGTAGRARATTPVGRSPRARLHAELLFGR